MKENNFQYSKKGDRQISKFFARGLLYDFVENKLDSERKASIEERVKQNPELQQEATKIKEGLEISKNLSMISVSEELLKKVAISSSYFYSTKENLNIDKWSPALKLGIEGSVIALGVAVMAIIIPWNSLLEMNIGPNQLVLSEITKNVESEVSEVSASQKESLEYPDENLQKNAGATVPTTTVPLVTVANSNAQVNAQTKTPEKSAEPVQKTPVVIAQTSPPAKVDIVTEKTVAGNVSEKRSGFLFRGTVYVTNLKATTPKLVEKVQELGGRKAGQVELGWFKGDSSYFHFTMPDNKYQDLESYFSTYGSMEIQREQHDRVMPDGIRRIIITVYEKK